MAILKNNTFLSLLSGVILGLSWYPYGFTFLIFFAFVPLLRLSDQLLAKKTGFAFWRGFYFSYLAFLVWNIGATWWIWNSTPPGSIAAIVLNSLFMSIVFGAWQGVKKSGLPKVAVPIAFIAFWCSWEFLHLNWEINWPWLNLGNVFATHPKWVQWYEFTGTFGGTIWVLAVNFLVYDFVCTLMKQINQNYSFKNYKTSTVLSYLGLLCAKKQFIRIITVILTPILISLILYKTYKIDHGKGIEAVIVQQNVDAWVEQYQKTNYELAELISETASTKLSHNTVLMVCPESAIPHALVEQRVLNMEIFPDHPLNIFYPLFYKHKQLNLVLGLSTISFFETKESPTMRESANGYFKDYYNTSCLYNKDTIVLYHKCKLVPGVEKMPYPKIFGFLEKLAIDLGGISGSLGSDTEQRVFEAKSDQGTVKVGAPICYESIFGELFSKFVKNGAQLMCVITNDDWWGNTPGYKQHFEMSRLRAIETRRYIMRAANTGISAFYDPLGNVHQKTAYKTRIAIAQTVYLNNKITFYTKNGDYLARIMLGISALCFLFFVASPELKICNNAIFIKAQKKPIFYNIAMNNSFFAMLF